MTAELKRKIVTPQRKYKTGEEIEDVKGKQEAEKDPFVLLDTEDMMVVTFNSEDVAACG